ncbi:hypothetical protein CBR_g34493 [Chara braunii]|uniref:Uncharacterized protein n=1 Tax=Chara braunii TaxID=69332 RepID=A0A388LIY3_CHABU|nr:hypothetical protein CBR_g34493 [Chara braunii]|eukprot:GBG82211.1 hypothetical protein CBR_g34493 [Chara braunii]
MLHRLADREDVLVEMVDGRSVEKWRALRWFGEKLRRRADLVYYTVRSKAWWLQVKRIVDIMRPIFQLLKRMDTEGTPPTNLVDYDDMIANCNGRKLMNVVLTKKDREDVIEKVCNRVLMMRQPIHAAAFVLDPQRTNERWLFDQNSPVMQNAMRFFLRLIGGECDMVESGCWKWEWGAVGSVLGDGRLELRTGLVRRKAGSLEAGEQQQGSEARLLLGEKAAEGGGLVDMVWQRVVGTKGDLREGAELEVCSRVEGGGLVVEAEHCGNYVWYRNMMRVALRAGFGGAEVAVVDAGEAADERNYPRGPVTEVEVGVGVAVESRL